MVMGVSKPDNRGLTAGQGSDSDGSSSDGDGAGPARGGSSGPDGKPGGDSKGGAEQQQKSGSEPPSIQREDWMTKPMKREGLTRTQQEAEEDRKQVWRGDRVFGAVVGDRYGSVAQLTEDLSAMSAAHGKAHLRAAAERRRQHADPVPHYLQLAGALNQFRDDGSFMDRFMSGASPQRGDHDDHGRDDGDLRPGPSVRVVQLPLVDASGRAVRGAFGREAAGAGTAPNAGKRAGQKAPQRYNKETGEKERYFADDDKVDLATMVRRAKYGDDDMQLDEHLAVNIAKKRKFRANDLDADAEYDYDGGIEMYENRSKRGNVEAQKSRDRNRQVADLRRQSQAEAGCMMCLSNPKRPAFLTVALGTCTYLSLPERGRLVRGHCCISPGEHLPSIRGLDEGAWTEVKNFIKCLIRMWGAQGQSVLFMETYMLRGGRRNHAVLEAFPVTERQLEKAKGYFKKALLEAESEWSTHHAKAVIDTTAQKFGYGAGYVHVIDDESKFDPNFGRQVLVGLLDLPPELTHARQRAEAPAAQQQAVREFEALWDPYDWTRQIDA
eukprot:XP_001701090.1 predicted protein [Chlamydomonas reinhardtii]